MSFALVYGDGALTVAVADQPRGIFGPDGAWGLDPMALRPCLAEIEMALSDRLAFDVMADGESRRLEHFRMEHGNRKGPRRAAKAQALFEVSA